MSKALILLPYIRTSNQRLVLKGWACHRCVITPLFDWSWKVLAECVLLCPPHGENNSRQHQHPWKYSDRGRTWTSLQNFNLRWILTTRPLVYTHTYPYTCMHTHIHTCIYTPTCTYACVYTHIHIHTHAWTYTPNSGSYQASQRSKASSVKPLDENHTVTLHQILS